MGLYDVLFPRNQYKQELAQWIVDHNNRAYLGIGLLYSHSVDDYYFGCTVEELEAKKARMEGVHQKYEYDRKHPKPKIGDVYSVYLCGKCVDTLRNVTNVSHNENGVFFTITLEDGTTRLKSYFGSGNIHWCKEG